MPVNLSPNPLPSARCLLRYGSFVQGKGVSLPTLWLLSELILSSLARQLAFPLAACFATAALCSGKGFPFPTLVCLGGTR
jgi:hypothetical protein